jgi:hypothetical protein
LLSCHRTSRAIALTAAGGGAGAAGSVIGRAPGRGTNGESIADLSELWKHFLKVLFYRRPDGAGGTPGRVGGGAGATAWQAKLRQIKAALRRRMHQPIPEQRKWLGQVGRGFFNDHAAPTNSRALAAFRHHVMDRWRRALERRSQMAHTIWARMTRLENDWLAKPSFTPKAQRSLRRQTPEPGTGCPNWAGPDPRAGRSAMSVPAAIRNRVSLSDLVPLDLIVVVTLDGMSSWLVMFHFWMAPKAPMVSLFLIYPAALRLGRRSPTS